MDFSQFDERKKAEEGILVVLKDPYANEAGEHPELGKDGFYVRGEASESYQAALAAEMFAEAETVDAKEGDTVEEVRKSLETSIHERDVEAALKLIIRATPEMSFNGKPVGDDKEQIRKVLNCCFPVLGVEEDADGNVKMRTVKAKDGSDLEIPAFKQENKTFAAQVLEVAKKRQAFTAGSAKA